MIHHHHNLQFFLVIVSTLWIMSARKSESQKPLPEDSTYDIIHQLEKKADFVYSAVEKYMCDA